MRVFYKKRGYILFCSIILLILIPLNIAQEVCDEPNSACGGDYEMQIVTMARAADKFDAGDNTHTILSILGQKFIGWGNDISNNTRVKLGFLAYFLNKAPEMTDLSAQAYKFEAKHPYTNDSILCEINITEYNVGDEVEIYLTWYKNSSSWYTNNETVTVSNIEDLIDEYNVSFEKWETDNEIINHTIFGSILYSTNTTPFNLTSDASDIRVGDGSLEAIDTKHYDIWLCSGYVGDGRKTSDWLNSTPLFIFNHPPDYDNSSSKYYEWEEDNPTTINMNDLFSDIDLDDLNWFINWTSNYKEEGFSIRDIDININNATGIVTLTPNGNITGKMDIIFVAVDDDSDYSDWYLNNDDGKTATSILTLNITQVNDAPWASEIYIDPAAPGYQDTLTCTYTYKDIENNPQDTLVTSFKWWIKDEGLGGWVNLNVNSSRLSPTYFDLDDEIICSVRVKDIYIPSSDESLWSTYTNSTLAKVLQETGTPGSGGEVVIGVG